MTPPTHGLRWTKQNFSLTSRFSWKENKLEELNCHLNYSPLFHNQSSKQFINPSINVIYLAYINKPNNQSITDCYCESTRINHRNVIENSEANAEGKSLTVSVQASHDRTHIKREKATSIQRRKHQRHHCFRAHLLAVFMDEKLTANKHPTVIFSVPKSIKRTPIPQRTNLQFNFQILHQRQDVRVKSTTSKNSLFGPMPKLRKITCSSM